MVARNDGHKPLFYSPCESGARYGRLAEVDAARSCGATVLRKNGVQVQTLHLPQSPSLGRQRFSVIALRHPKPCPERGIWRSGAAAAREAHNLEIAGSSPASATTIDICSLLLFFRKHSRDEGAFLLPARRWAFDRKANK